MDNLFFNTFFRLKKFHTLIRILRCIFMLSFEIVLVVVGSSNDSAGVLLL